MDYGQIRQRLTLRLKPYGPALLIALVGILLMLLPGRPETAPPEPTQAASQEEADLARRLEVLLSQMDGAGQVKILLTEAKGEKSLYQVDVRQSGGDASDSQTVILSQGSSQSRPLVTQRISPVYQGAVVLCQGADSSYIRLAITQAVSKATGLGANDITVLKLK